MKRRSLAILLALSMVFGNSAGVMAADYDSSREIEIEAVEAEASSEDIIVVADQEDAAALSVSEEGESDIFIEEASEEASDGVSPEETAVEISDISESDTESGSSGNHVLNYREVELQKPVGSPDVTSDASYSGNSNYEAAKYITPKLPKLRDQDPYGTCWAHAAIALAEINLITKGDSSTGIDFSELHLAYFTYNHVTDPLGGTEGDYNGISPTLFEREVDPSQLLDKGGSLYFAQNILASWMGAADESTVPYEDADKVLGDYVATGKGLPDSVAYDNAAHMTHYYDVTMPNYHYVDADGYEYVNTNFENEFAPVKKLIVDHGAVGVSFNASDSTTYNGKKVYTYNEENNAYYFPGKTRTNHVVSIVGWDDNFSKDNFNVTAPGDGAWYVRNSWYDESGWSWGSNQCYEGYFWMSYYDDSLYRVAYAFDYTLGSTYDHNYQYDGTMNTGYDTGDKAANVFTIHGGSDAETLKAVSFVASDVDQDYKIEIYKDLTDEKNPESGTLVATKNITTSYEGYYTVPLDNEIKLTKGETFSVVLTLGTPYEGEYYYTIELTGKDWYDVRSSAKEGQSFLLKDGEWIDYGKEYNSNVRIKAFTDDSSNVVPGGISFDKSTYEADQGDYIIPVVTITPENATDKKYTLQTSDKSIVKVVDGTKLAALKEGTVTITAVSDRGNYQATATVTVKKSYTFSIEGNSPLYLGDEATFTIATNPKDAVIKHEVIFESGNTKVLTIDSKTGKAKAVGIGVSKLKATIGCRSVERYISVNMATPEVTADIASDNTVTLSWKHVNGAEYYNVKDYNYNTLAENLKPDANNNCSYVDKTHVGETQKNYSVTYVVRAYGLNAEGNDTQVETAISIKLNSKKYTITYVLNGGTNHSMNPTEYYEDSEINLYPPSVNPYGFIFRGWFTDPDFKNQKYRIEKSDKGDLTLYAKYTSYLKTHNVKYVLGVGTNDPANPSSYVEGTTFTLKDAIAPAGYKFEGWYSDKKFSTKKNQIVSSDKVDLTFYANYIETSTDNTITYVLDDGATNPNPASYSSKSVLKLKKATKTGYTFGGWYKDSDYKKKVTSIKKGTKGPITLYGKLTPIKYSVKFNGRGASNSMSNQKIEYDKAESLKASTLKKKGYTFTGWNTKADGSGVSYADGAKVKNLADKKGKVVTLYAQWDEDIYTITYDLDGGINAAKNPATYSVTKTVKLQKPTKAGYVFNGWYKTKTADGKYKGKVTKIAKGSVGNKTLYAKFTEIRYTVKFNGNGATGGKMDSMTKVSAAEKVTLNANEFTRDGHTFKGWNTKKKGRGISVSDKEVLFAPEFITKNGQTITLYAQWD